jgi:hypothetical protein
MSSSLAFGRNDPGPLSVRPIPVGQTDDAVLEHDLRLPSQQNSGLLDVRPGSGHVGGRGRMELQPGRLSRGGLSPG